MSKKYIVEVRSYVFFFIFIISKLVLMMFPIWITAAHTYLAIICVVNVSVNPHVFVDNDLTYLGMSVTSYQYEITDFNTEWKGEQIKSFHICKTIDLNLTQECTSILQFWLISSHEVYIRRIWAFSFLTWTSAWKPKIEVFPGLFPQTVEVRSSLSLLPKTYFWLFWCSGAAVIRVS